MSPAERLQRLFHDGVTSGRPDAALLESVHETARFEAAARLRVYAEMYVVRLVEALRSDFPCLAALAGDEDFFALASAYVTDEPSRHPSIARAGERLPAWLRAHAGRWARSDLADLAELEWARSESFDELDPRPADAAALAVLGGEQAAAARLLLTASLRQLTLAHDVVPLWRALDAGEVPPPPAAAVSHVVVFRRGYAVVHAPLGAQAALALTRARDGARLEEVCDAFCEAEDPVEAALAELGSWLADGWVEDVLAPDAVA